MATRRGAASTAPSLKPEQAIPVLEGHILQGEGQLWPERYDSPKRVEWIQTGRAALIASLGSDDAAIQAFGSAQCGVYGPDDTDETLHEQATRQLDSMIAILRSAIQQLRWKLPDPKQVFIPAGSPHDAYVQIRTIIQQATTEVFIIDSWVDGTLWPLLTNVPATCKVRILSENLKGDFVVEARKFIAQHGTSVEVRRTTTYHDRFIFLDRKRCFHLGASIKDAGNKAFALSEFERQQIIASTFADAEAEWLTATPVVI